MSQWKASEYIVDPEVVIGELNLLNKQVMEEYSKPFDLLKKRQDEENMEKNPFIEINIRILRGTIDIFIDEHINLVDHCRNILYLDRSQYENLIEKRRKKRDVLIENSKLITNLIKESKND